MKSKERKRTNNTLLFGIEAYAVVCLANPAPEMVH